MKNLIYFASFGKKIYKDMTKESIRSIRNVGYSDDIIVLTDYIYDFGDASCIYINDPDFFISRANIHKYIDITQYNKLLYLDTDTLVIKNINTLFESDFCGMTISVDDEYLTYHNMQCLTEKEKDTPSIFNSPSINSGTFLISSNIAKEYYELWYDEWSKKSNPHDQPSLQSLVIRNKIKCNFFGEVCCFPLLYGLNKNSSIIHLCGLDRENINAKEELLIYMKRINDSFNGEYDIDTIFNIYSEFNKKYLKIQRNIKFNKFKNTLITNKLNDSINRKVIDYIIPVSNSGNSDFQDRLDNLNFVLKTFLSNQTQVKLTVYLIEQVIDKNLPKFCDNIIIPNELNVVIKTVEYHIFCKPWLYNIGVKISNGSYIIFGDLDNWADRNYFKDLIDFVNKKNLKWCVAWDRLVLLTKERKTKLLVNETIDRDSNYNILPDFESHTEFMKNLKFLFTSDGYLKPHPEWYSGNAILITREFFINEIFGVNELFVKWGSEDCELITRLSKTSGTYEWYPLITTHLWHAPTKHKEDSTSNFNKNLDVFVKRDDNYMVMNNILKDSDLANENGPISVDGTMKKYNIIL